MKLKRLTCLITILAFSGQTLLLSGCAEGAGGASATGSNANPPVGGEENLNDHRLWTNITGYDNTSKGSQLDLSFNNNSSNDLELVGCDNDPTIKNNLESNIPGLFAAQRTKKFDSKWSAYANSTGSILDAKHIPDNNLSFNGSSSRNYNCYYRIFHPEAGAFLYVKLNAQEVKLATHGAGTVGQPNIDMKALADSSMGAAVKGGDLKLSDLSKPLDWSSQKNAEFSLVGYTDKVIRSGYSRRFDKINQELMMVHMSSLASSNGKLNDFMWDVSRSAQNDLENYIKTTWGFSAKDAQKIIPKIARISDVEYEFDDLSKRSITVFTDKGKFYNLADSGDFIKFQSRYDVSFNLVQDDPKEEFELISSSELDQLHEARYGKRASIVSDLMEEASVKDAEEFRVLSSRGIPDLSLHRSLLEIEADPGVRSVIGDEVIEPVTDRAVFGPFASVSGDFIGGALMALPILAYTFTELINALSGSGTNGKA